MQAGAPQLHDSEDKPRQVQSKSTGKRVIQSKGPKRRRTHQVQEAGRRPIGPGSSEQRRGGRQPPRAWPGFWTVCRTKWEDWGVLRRVGRVDVSFVPRKITLAVQGQGDRLTRRIFQSPGWGSGGGDMFDKGGVSRNGIKWWFSRSVFEGGFGRTYRRIHCGMRQKRRINYYLWVNEDLSNLMEDGFTVEILLRNSGPVACC